MLNLAIFHCIKSFLISKPKIEFESFINEGCQHLCNKQAIDLLKQMLCYDLEGRITAFEAMNHPFFDSLKVESKVEK